MRMSNIKWMLPVVAIWFFAGACNSSKQAINKQNKNDVSAMDADTLDEIELTFSKEKIYRGSNPIKFDLLHTKLDVQIDWEKQRMPGKAFIKLKPHFYSTDSLILDAKGFDIREVALVSKTGTMESLKYRYDSLQIHIALPRTFTSKDTLNVFVDYTAKPNERKTGGSAAIQSDKGLYFINPLGKEAGKPTQLWTQGETEANSCWFPTIEATNLRCTGEIIVTCEKKYKTLSNGLLVASRDNGNGTRTDNWVMDKPHAPYLFMLTVGEFAVVKDKWRNLAVDYYVEPEYEPYAKDIFGNTPEMMEFFSQLLGFTYPWQKYSQIIVRDYVSGAMENTSASLFGEFVQRTKRELLDANYEDIVAHELFHQWFGDLVTCESWSNIPLNESFANYSEYLWAEYKYGKLHADKMLQDNLKQYFDEAQGKNVDLIRFYYESQEEMFDRHSYEKGGHVLHMLRNVVGDKAFFDALQLYLKTHQYKPVEIHQLRLAFEEVSGLDLNWFFNQWFLNNGHPKLTINYEYKNDSVFVEVEQKHNTDVALVYHLPAKIALWNNGKMVNHSVTLTKEKQTFAFASSTKPTLIDFDADRILLATKKENKQISDYIFQYKNHPQFLAKLEALRSLREAQKDNAEAKQALITALSDTFYYFRRYAVEAIKLNKDSMPETVKQVEKMALTDAHAHVRNSSVQKLSRLKDKQLIPVFEKALGDSSYATAAEALKAIQAVDTALAVSHAAAFENENNYDIVDAVCSIYAASGSEKFQTFFEKKFTTVKGYAKYTLMYHYANFLTNMKKDLVIKGTDILKNQALSTETKLLASAGKGSIKRIVKSFEEKKKEVQKIIDDAKQKDKGDAYTLIADYDLIISNANDAVAAITKKYEDEKKN
jgi:aminopeptidase N